MSIEELKARTFRFGLDIARIIEDLPHSTTARSLGNQLLRSATSVGANYRAACRARSRADFISKLKIVEEECDETLYWLELLTTGGWMKSADVANLAKEGITRSWRLLWLQSKPLAHPTCEAFPNSSFVIRNSSFDNSAS